MATEKTISLLSNQSLKLHLDSPIKSVCCMYSAAMNSEEACVRKCSLPGINVQSTTTASDPWLS